MHCLSINAILPLMMYLRSYLTSEPPAQESRLRRFPTSAKSLPWLKVGHGRWRWEGARGPCGATALRKAKGQPEEGAGDIPRMIHAIQQLQDRRSEGMHFDSRLLAAAGRRCGAQCAVVATGGVRFTSGRLADGSHAPAPGQPRRAVAPANLAGWQPRDPAS